MLAAAGLGAGAAVAATGTASPGWMGGGTLPATMMSTGMMGGSTTDPGKVMGTFANAPGPRVSAAQAVGARCR